MQFHSFNILVHSTPQDKSKRRKEKVSLKWAKGLWAITEFRLLTYITHPLSHRLGHYDFPPKTNDLE